MSAHTHTHANTRTGLLSYAVGKAAAEKQSRPSGHILVLQLAECELSQSCTCGNRRPRTLNHSTSHSSPKPIGSDGLRQRSTPAWGPTPAALCALSLLIAVFFFLSGAKLQLEDNKWPTSLTPLDRPHCVNQTGRPEEDLSLLSFVLAVFETPGILSALFWEYIKQSSSTANQQCSSAEPHYAHKYPNLIAE